MILNTGIPVNWRNNFFYQLFFFVAGIIVLPAVALYLYKKSSEMATIKLTTQEFKDKIFDFTKEQEWNYKGDLPAIIDFYADWCGPCKMMAPIMEELSTEYENQLIVYKVDTSAEKELASIFGIQSIPTFLFIPLEEEPMIQTGALPKKEFKEIIEERMLFNTPE